MNTTTYNRKLSPGLLRVGLPVCLLALTLALIGCSSTKTRIDHGRISARTFSFLNTGPRTLPAYAEARKEAHAMIQAALIKNLSAKGVSQAATGGDVTVGYLVIVGNNAETTSLNQYFGYGPEANALVDQVHKEQTVKNQDRNYFEAGTLVVDFIDPKTFKVLQRRTIQAQLLRNMPMTRESRSARVQAVVDQALKDVTFVP